MGAARTLNSALNEVVGKYARASMVVGVNRVGLREVSRDLSVQCRKTLEQQ